jgi:anti-sigma factor RsiW
MTCEELAAALQDYCCGDLVVEVRETCEAHVAVCPACGALVRTYRYTVRVAALLPRCRLTAAAEARLRAALAAELGDG